MKRQTTQEEEKFANLIFDKRLVSEIYKDILKLKNKKINNPSKKWARILNGHYSKEVIQIAKNT